MATHCFGLYQGHLTQRLIKQVSAKFPEVSVINYTEPRGEKRGWFCCPSLGHPFDDATADEVLGFARSVASDRDYDKLRAPEEEQASGYGDWPMRRHRRV